ncbi:MULTISPECIES: ABC transporter permease subunit [unclassified Leptolyngbya]|uniref:ABC transporter permease subunit n=1 Tax=unclassified Leptolyngbya TaxID=2650499 RepID=UPI001687ABED|nr:MULTISPECIES: ABC transporter permease subunit [unclassified Leptolyngbya]MBD1910022.1 ABC transporter permease subunit [Leptolyngbya sp. FACHB-8]MBD2156844.1 ABC transporter permease subunit [Leptolyngbya sp. FACHB-16]
MAQQRSWKGKLWQRSKPWVMPVALLLIWQLLAQLGWLRVELMPPPSSVLSATVELIESGELLHHMAVSSARAVAGFIVGGGFGFLLGLLNGLSRSAEEYLDASMQMLRNIPNLAMVPLAILWFGIHEESKLFLVAIGVFFPIYMNTFHGVRSVDPELIEMSKVYGLRSWNLFWHVILPGAMSSILIGFRHSLGITWVTIIVAETIAADSGIGYLATQGREFLRTDIVMLCVILYALLGKLADSAARMLEQSWLRWHPGYQNPRLNEAG